MAQLSSNFRGRQGKLRIAFNYVAIQNVLLQMLNK